MADTITTITHLINSPPGQLAAGGVLAGIVWKFFERVEAVLNEDTKLEIAVWLLDQKAAPHFDKWVGGVLTIFFSICGTENAVFPSHSGVLRRRIRASLFMGVACWIPCTMPVVYDLYTKTKGVICSYTIVALVAAIFLCSTVAFFSLGWCNVARYRIYISKHFFLPVVTLLLMIGFIVPVLMFRIMMFGHFISGIATTETLAQCLLRWWLSAGFSIILVSLWLGLSTLAGMILKAACRFDRAFRWFKAHFDIEKKPLQSIGLVAGSLFAMAYWTGTLTNRFFHWA
jgi:hypothetical protein